MTEDMHIRTFSHCSNDGFNLYMFLICACVILDIRCDNFMTPLNGEITSCSSGSMGVGYEGDTCSFTCNTGYELTGSDTRTCQSDGSWSGSETMCRRARGKIYLYEKLFSSNLQMDKAVLILLILNNKELIH